MRFEQFCNTFFTKKRKIIDIKTEKTTFKKKLTEEMMKRFLYFFVCVLSAFSSLSANEISFKDFPNDDGGAILIEWETDRSDVSSVLIEREIKGTFVELKKVPYLKGTYSVRDEVEPGLIERFKVSFLDSGNNVILTRDEEIAAKAQWFNSTKLPLLILAIIIPAAIIYFIYSAKSGKELYIRKIGGLESLEESVGRATELGRPILYIPGTLDIDDMQTIAGLTILGKLAQKAAEYETRLIVPVNRSMVLSTAKEIVKEAYLKAGKPDSYDPDSVFYLTDDQFGYVAGVDGIIMREKPAANFYLGAFYAESLILAETGFSSGAIQTAGTAMPSQLPFFVAACDFTLIGEELFAASAYLSKEPNQLGSLKGQDFGKALFLVLLLTGVILEVSGVHFLKKFLEIN